jgi:hypothetical protein
MLIFYDFYEFNYDGALLAAQILTIIKNQRSIWSIQAGAQQVKYAVFLLHYTFYIIHISYFVLLISHFSQFLLRISYFVLRISLRNLIFFLIFSDAC